MAIGTAAAIVGGSLIGAAGSAIASKKAAKATTKAANTAADEQRRQYDQTRQDQMPWLESGRNALGRLDAASTGDMSGFFASPDYNFRRTDGMRDIQQTAAARGSLGSGNALKALAEFNSNLAAGEFGNWWNRQAGIAGAGQTTGAQLGAQGANAASNIGNSMMAAGDARASGILGVGNSLAGNINSGLNNLMLYRGGYFNAPQQQLAPNALAHNYRGGMYGSVV